MFPCSAGLMSPITILLSDLHLASFVSPSYISPKFKKFLTSISNTRLPRHLIHELHLMTSISATPLSHLPGRAAVDKFSRSVFRFHLLEAAGSRKVPEIKGFRAYFPSPLITILPSPPSAADRSACAPLDFAGRLGMRPTFDAASSRFAALAPSKLGLQHVSRLP